MKIKRFVVDYKMIQPNQNSDFIFRSFINSFMYLYEDAEYFHQEAKNLDKSCKQVQLCRTALLLYILSLEGLINRALDHFLPDLFHDFFLEREEKFSLEDKWLMLPLLLSKNNECKFDKSSYPWSHFVELIRIRNDFVHPKHDRPAYYRPITSHHWESLRWNDIPEGVNLKETDIIYRQTKILKNPNAIHPEHVSTVKIIVDDIIAELDKLLGGKINKNNWLRNDEMVLIFPPGAKLGDLVSLNPTNSPSKR